MKQLKLNLFLLCVALLIVNSCSMIGTKKAESIVGTWNGKSPQEQDIVAMVISINGILEFRRTSSDDWTSAKVKDNLSNGYQLRTQTGDKAMIAYTSGTRVLINENTNIEIQADIASPGEKPSVERTRIMIGEIYNQVKGNYEVETPSSVASVRGTEFNVSSTLDEDTYIGVEGIIEIMNEFGSVILSQLQTTTVARDQAPEDPTDISQDEVDDATAWTEGVEPTWKLNLIPEHGTEHPINEAFGLSIWALKEGSIDQDATFALTAFGADAEGIEYSTDSGGTWNTSPPQITLISGQAIITCRLTEETTLNITAEADDSQTATLAVTAKEPKETKTIEMRFTNPDGEDEKTLIWELEEK